jgi:hypothetical protein
MCDCIKKIDESLKNEGYTLDCTFPIDKLGSEKPILRTSKLVGWKPEPGAPKRRSIVLVPNFCPFCGKPYEKKGAKKAAKKGAKKA